MGTPLREWDINIYRGVLTGYNDAFIIDSAKREEILLNCETEEERLRTTELIRPILRGRDIKRYSYDWAGLWLINTHNGVKGRLSPIDINDYPSVKQYLDLHWEKIKKREDKGITPYNLRNCAYMDDFNKPKITWGNLNLNATFALVPEGFIINAPSPFIATTNHTLALLHILNSKISDYYIRKLGVTRNGGYFEYKPMFVEQLPVPKIGLEVLEKYPLNPSNEQQTEIEQIIYKLYNLSEKEIELLND